MTRERPLVQKPEDPNKTKEWEIAKIAPPGDKSHADSEEPKESEDDI